MLGFSRRWVSWQSAKNLSYGLSASLLFFFLYVWKLGTLLPALSAHEAAARHGSSTLGNIIDNPVNAPHKIIQWFFQLLDYHGAFWMRSVSVFYVLVFLLSLYLVLRMWFGRFIAIVGILFFSTTPWVILAGRSAAPDVMWLSPFLFMLSYAALCRSGEKINIAWTGLLISIIICLYTPGLIWFLLLALIIKAKKITPAILKVKRQYLLAGFTLLLLMILPLLYATIKDISIGKDLLLIPHYFAGTPTVVQNLLWSGASLAYHLPAHMDYAIGRLPILGLTQAVLAVFGVYAMWHKARRETLIVLSLLTISIVATAFSGNMLLLFISLPAIAILDAAGLRYLYTKWFSVFPLNPLAKVFAVCIVSLLLLAHVAYGVRYALLAWPHNVETRKIYMVK
jgi:hypothetical protein